MATFNRERVLREGVIIGERLISVGVIVWEDDVIPLLMFEPGEFRSRIVGSVTELEREPDGWITGEVTMFEDEGEFDPERQYLAAQLSSVYGRSEDDGVTTITTGRLLMVYAHPIPVPKWKARR